MSFDFLAGINSLGSSVFGVLIPFLFVLTLVVFFHELGHFLVARWCGVRVMVFSVGFGPELFGFNDRHGTRWKVSAIPLGGYVKFFGDDNAASVPDQAAIAGMSEEERRVSFVHQRVGPRAAIVVAGPLANFLLAIVIFAGLFMMFGKPSTSPRVDTVQPGSAAEAAGFQPGDLVLTINGRPIDSFPDMQQIVSTSAGQELVFEVDRGGTRVTLKATPALKEVKDRFGNVQPAWASLASRARIRRTMNTSSRSGRCKPSASACSGRGSWSSVRCPISAASSPAAKPPISSAARSGSPRCRDRWRQRALPSLFSLAAVLSVSIGLLNLFPVPLLDGGHLLFYGIEAVRGKPLSERAQEMGFRIGLAIVLMLMIFATYNDILHLAAQWTAS